MALISCGGNGCFSPRYDEPSCRQSQECPAGLTCDGEVCRRPEDLVDAAEIDAAEIDAVIDAREIDGPVDACVPDPLGERCNGLDDDCDLQIDETFPILGDACDGPDTDQCLDDAVACNVAGDGTTCANAAPDDDVERCNGLDDDCDTTADEDFPTLGDACDGADGDACLEGGVVCSADGTGVTCDDLTPTTSEVCNNLDDDCDLSADEEFPTLGQACDGADGDACLEGLVECDPATGGTRCSDLTPTIPETCNMMDDDCDLSTDEDFDLTSDPANCGQCGRVCTNGFGTTTCAASTCMPTCTAGSNDCDGNPVNGCELRDTNVPCGGALDIGDVNGDIGADTITRTGSTEAFFRVTVSESVPGTTPVVARVQLTSAPGTNFDLFVTCTICGGTTLSSNTTGVDTLNVGANDVTGIGDTYDILIGVRWTSSTACGNWTLVVTGNVPTTNRSCD